ncbi:MAG: tyrosine--tRNA ligase [Candidatus Gracilibacteria bacterium]
MSVNTDEKAVDQLLSLGVADVIVKKDLKEKLMSGKQLRIKLGIDPTGFDLHLGHMVVVRKLREFQELGHQIILLFGNFTGQIGDPSGKSETRPLRTQAELEKNAEHYLKQVSGILDIKKVEVRWNAEWLAPLSLSDVVLLASQFTVAQMMDRDMFQERVKKDQPISLHEFLYPLMVGYDSVALKADVELGGTDQTFNLLACRPIQKAYGQEPQNVLTVPLLLGTDGAMKMGKTTGNYIGVSEKPEDIFGKTMSIPDHLILTYCELAGRMDEAEVAEFKKRLEGGENPLNLKMELGHAIVELYHGEKAAHMAEEHFKTVHQKKEVPDDVEEVALQGPKWNIVDLICELKLAATKSDARRLVEGGGVKWEGKKLEDVKTEVALTKKGALLQVGKRNFRRVKG